VISLPDLPMTNTVEHRIGRLVGRICAQWTEQNSRYFEWHYSWAAGRMMA
jgi:hypothetical protein